MRAFRLLRPPAKKWRLCRSTRRKMERRFCAAREAMLAFEPDELEVFVGVPLFVEERVLRPDRKKLRRRFRFGKKR